MQEVTTYVGRFTAGDLKEVEQKITTLAHLRNWKRIYDSGCKVDPTHRNADYEISLYETLSILDPLSQRTPKALIGTLYEYKNMLAAIERSPGQFSTKHLTPEVAKAWYSEQIEDIRRILKTCDR